MGCFQSKPDRASKYALPDGEYTLPPHPSAAGPKVRSMKPMLKSFHAFWGCGVRAGMNTAARGSWSALAQRGDLAWQLQGAAPEHAGLRILGSCIELLLSVKCFRKSR